MYHAKSHNFQLTDTFNKKNSNLSPSVKHMFIDSFLGIKFDWLIAWSVITQKYITKCFNVVYLKFNQREFFCSKQYTLKTKSKPSHKLKLLLHEFSLLYCP